MIVSIHQPNFLPWLGFFDKMAKSDLMILLDTVPYRKRSYQNRVKVKSPNGPQWLTIPVETKGKFAQITHDVKILGNDEWKWDHLKMFKLYYGKSVNFDGIFPKIERLYHNFNGEYLVDFTIPSIELIKNALDINTKLVKASSLNVYGKKSNLLANLVREVDGSTYLSGPTGKNYLDEEIFRKKGIRVTYHDFTVFPYEQLFGDFQAGLSAVDYLFNTEGPNPWLGGEK